MDKLNIIGYYKESPIVNEAGEQNEKLLYMVVYENNKIDGSQKWLEGYNVLEGHFEIKDKVYLHSCKKITKDEYKAATKGWYTPKEYLQ